MLFGFFWSLIMFLIAITLLIAFHEYGHFIIARFFNVKITRFSVGFGKIIWSRVDKKGTEFALSLLPIGGYVKMLDERVEPVTDEDLPYAFNRKPIWQRACIILAGPIFNLIFAIAAYWLMFIVGVTHLAPIIGEVEPGSIAAAAGLSSSQQITAVNQHAIYSWPDFSIALAKKIGEKTRLPLTVRATNNTQKTVSLDLSRWHYDASDAYLLDSLGITPAEPDVPAVIDVVLPNTPAAKAGLVNGQTILAIDKYPVNNWQQVVSYIKPRANQQLTIKVKKDNIVSNVQVTVGEQTITSGEKLGYLGIQSVIVPWPDEMKTIEHYGVIESFIKAVVRTYDNSVTTILLLGKMIIGKISFKGISGPIGIAQGAGFSASMGFAHYLSFLALVSISLAVINLLPIPMLDGGQFIFCLLEAVIRRPIPEKIQEVCIKVGILLLLSVMLLAIYNDLMRL